MSVTVLEMNDAGLLATPEAPSGPPMPASPGYALIEGHQVIAGRAAAEQARLKPKRVHNRFWNALSTAPLAHPFPADLSAADLAHAHLRELWQPLRRQHADVILALPGTFSRHQAGLVLGIARACGIPVVGLVDSALAACAGRDLRGPAMHLDLQLHRAVATQLVGNGHLARGELHFSDDTGLAGIQHRVARKIADLFVGTTRLDPLHDGATEQELYLAVPGLLARLCESDRLTFELRPEGPVGVELGPDPVTAAIASDYAVLHHLARLGRERGARVLLLSSRVARLPGLGPRLVDDLGVELIVLPEEAAALGALRHRDGIRAAGDALPFVTRFEDHGTP